MLFLIVVIALLSTRWTQTAEDLEVILRLPEGSGKSAKKQLQISILPDRLSVTRRSGDGEVLLDTELQGVIRAGESTWTISRDSIEFSLEKQTEGTWQQLEKK